MKAKTNLGRLNIEVTSERYNCLLSYRHLCIIFDRDHAQITLRALLLQD